MQTADSNGRPDSSTSFHKQYTKKDFHSFAHKIGSEYDYPSSCAPLLKHAVTASASHPASLHGYILTFHQLFWQACWQMPYSTSVTLDEVFCTVPPILVAFLVSLSPTMHSNGGQSAISEAAGTTLFWQSWPIYRALCVTYLGHQDDWNGISYRQQTTSRIGLWTGPLLHLHSGSWLYPAFTHSVTLQRFNSHLNNQQLSH